MNTDTILNEVANGRELSSEELLFLMKTEDHCDQIIELADDLNRQVNHDIVTFVHNRNINYTNICRNRCLFCGFRRSGSEADSFVLSVKDVLDRIGSTPGITEVCIQGGILPGLSFSFILEMLQAVKENYPRIHIHGFSPMEIKYFSEIW